MNPSDFKNKRILITGGTGFFGKNLCEALLDMNSKHNLSMTLFVMARKEVNLDGVIFIKQDITEDFHFNEKIDFIIHAATPVVNDQSTPDELLNIIVNGTQKITEFAIRSGCKRFLLVSSGGAYGEQPADMDKIPETHFDKVHIMDSKNPYGTGKRISELVVHNIFKNTDVEYVIARCFAFSGKNLALDQHFAIGNFVKDAVDNGKINVKGDGSAIRSYMDSDDLSVWILSMLVNGKTSEAYNLGSDEAISIDELAKKIAGMTDATVHIQNISEGSLKKNRYVPSIAKAQNELGLQLNIDLNHSLKKMIELYRKTK